MWSSFPDGTSLHWQSGLWRCQSEMSHLCLRSVPHMHRYAATSFHSRSLCLYIDTRTPVLV